MVLLFVEFCLGWTKCCDIWQILAAHLHMDSNWWKAAYTVLYVVWSSVLEMISNTRHDKHLFVYHAGPMLRKCLQHEAIQIFFHNIIAVSGMRGWGSQVCQCQISHEEHTKLHTSGAFYSLFHNCGIRSCHIYIRSSHCMLGNNRGSAHKQTAREQAPGAVCVIWYRERVRERARARERHLTIPGKLLLTIHSQSTCPLFPLRTVTLT